MQAKPSSVIIVGGGVVGLSAACFALREGCEVTVLDANAADATNCSMGNAGMIVPSHFVPLASPGVIGLGLRWMLRPESPLGIRPQVSPRFLRWLWLFCLSATRHDSQQAHQLLCQLNLESRSLFVEMAREADFGLTTRGLLMLCKKQRTLDEEAHMAEQTNALGLRAEVLDAAGVTAVDPAIEMAVAGAVHFKDDAHLDPARFMEVLRQRILREGGRIEHAFRIEHLERHKGRITAVSGPAGRREADQFVLAGGVWTAELARQIGLNLPLVAGKGYSLTLREPRRLPQLCS
ncbi:MAG TPA: FAD-dependent oxidoreductase, partial [Luteolibacter sp.]|nr:FAD-dependent oxidoreductase [Luteolibacter sp.]